MPPYGSPYSFDEVRFAAHLPPHSVRKSAVLCRNGRTSDWWGAMCGERFMPQRHQSAQQRMWGEAFGSGLLMQGVEGSQHGGQSQPLGPLEWPQRVVDAQAHGQVDGGWLCQTLGQGTDGPVHQQRHAPEG